jgi:hypothetical protein
MPDATTKRDALQPGAAEVASLFVDWFDPIEAALRDRVRAFIETMISSELDAALARPRYARRLAGQGGEEVAAEVVGHRHGRRTRTLTGTFGATEVSVPRARIAAGNGGTVEWRSKALRAYQRRTRTADALIAGAYLAGTNTRRVKRALAALFQGAVGKDVVSRTWRRLKSDWEAWQARDLSAEPIVRLILDGTVVRVRLDCKATSISLLVVLGVRADGQKVLLAVKNMGGESEAAWRALLDDLAARGLRAPDLIIVDGAPGLEKALAALWPEVPVQRCGVPKRRAAWGGLHGPQAPEPAGARSRQAARGGLGRLPGHDLRRHRQGGRAAPQGLPAQVAAQVPGGRRQPGGGRPASLHLHPIADQPMEVGTNDQCHRAPARGIQAPDQDTDRATRRRDRGHAVLGAARLGPDHHAQDRRLAEPRRTDYNTPD